MAKKQGYDALGRFDGKLTPELGRKIVMGVREGLFDSQNAMRHGVGAPTLRSWVERGLDEEAEEPYRSFAEAYLKESIALEERLIGQILKAADAWERRKHAEETYDFDCDSSDSPGGKSGSRRKVERITEKGDWHAAAWFLERRWPLRWGQNRQPEGGPSEALKLPETVQNRARKVREMTVSPPPELIKAFREAGYDLVKRDVSESAKTKPA